MASTVRDFCEPGDEYVDFTTSQRVKLSPRLIGFPAVIFTRRQIQRVLLTGPATLPPITRTNGDSS